MLRTKRFADKLIIKPQGVDAFYMHMLRSARHGWEAATANVPPTVAFVKHLRDHGEQCSELTTELPADTD